MRFKSDGNAIAVTSIAEKPIHRERIFHLHVYETVGRRKDERIQSDYASVHRKSSESEARERARGRHALFTRARPNVPLEAFFCILFFFFLHERRALEKSKQDETNVYQRIKPIRQRNRASSRARAD